MTRIVLTIDQPADNLPLLDAEFLTRFMQAMTSRGDSRMTWCLTVDGVEHASYDGDLGELT